MATSVHYLRIAKNSRENFCGKLKNRESLAQWIFPHLQYVVNAQSTKKQLAIMCQLE